MITMNELVDLRMQQHIAHEIYRQQIMQRIPDPFPPMMPIPMPRHVIMPPRITLPGVDVTLQNDDLWKQFHQIGTEMIITKSGRRMFPSMRLSLSGLDEDTNYCVLFEMVPIGDCRYKFSGSQWVPAGGAEPQSPQRMYLHPDSPATGAHWQAQPILFSKVKLTNNTLDNSGQIVLASMHKYQPRIHVIRTADLAQIPWAPQQAFVFPETEFVAVTAYQNDRITKLKIDNNPFAKGFRETGQSRCKRKMSSSPTADDQQLNDQTHTHSYHAHAPHHHQHQQQQQQHQQAQQQQQQPQHLQLPPHHMIMSPTKSCTTAATISESGSSICSSSDKPVTAFFNDHIIVDGDVVDTVTSSQIKRLRSNDVAASLCLSQMDGSLGDGSNNAGGGGGGNGSGGNGGGGNGSGGNSVGGNGIADIICETSSNSNLDYVSNNSGHLQYHQQAAAAAAAAIAVGNNVVVGGGINTSCNATSVAFMHHFQQNMQSLLRPSLVDLACTYFARPQPMYPQHAIYAVQQQQHQQQQQQQHEAALLAAGLTPTNALQQQPAPPPSLTSPLTTTGLLAATTNITQHLPLTGGGGGGEEIANRVTAINSNTTLDGITNDADLSSSDSSLIQDDTHIPTTTPPPPPPSAPVTAGTTTTSSMAASNRITAAVAASPDDTLPQSPTGIGNNSSGGHHSNGVIGHRKKGFSISAILGGGS